MEKRSQQQQPQHSRPSYPQISTHSIPTSVYPSSSSLSSISSAAPQKSPSMLQTQQGGFISAPLPSPSSSQPSNYFSSLSPQLPTSNPTQQHQQQQRKPQEQSVAGPYLGQRGDGGGAPETAPFLKDFNLVAEAAKRAQMACLTRDLGDVGL